MVKLNQGIKEIEEILSCSQCVYRKTTEQENEICSYYQETIPEGIDWGCECPHFSRLYDFTTKLQQGEAQERQLDIFFSKWFIVDEADPCQQRQGIDRLFYRKEDNEKISVQYKSDFCSDRTGNVFVEVISSCEDAAPGWAWRCSADILVYYLPNSRVAYILSVSTLKDANLPPFLLIWAKQFPWRSIKSTSNDRTWTTQGVLVPVAEFSKVCMKIIKIK